MNNAHAIGCSRDKAMMKEVWFAFAFFLLFQGILSLSNVGTSNTYTAVSYKKGESSLSLTYEKTKVDTFTTKKDVKIATDSSCSILCLKEGLGSCDSFVIWDNNGVRTCRMGIGGTGDGDVEILSKPNATQLNSMQL